ncbi:MAG: hypothetical protein ACJAZ9_000990 [Neolewinella sp.]|jgi:hypothetical protein
MADFLVEVEGIVIINVSVEKNVCIGLLPYFSVVTNARESFFPKPI